MSRDYCDECGDSACMKTLGLSKLLRKDWQSNAAPAEVDDATTPARQVDQQQLRLLDTTPPTNSSSLGEDINSEVVKPPTPANTSPTQKAAKGFSPSGRASLGKMESLFYEGNPIHIPFSADMFLFDKNRMFTPADTAILKRKSIESKDALLGHLIRLEMSASKDGIYLVTGVRKQRGKATEYCLISRTEKIVTDPGLPTVTYAELWMTLQRAEGKSGAKFTVIRNSTEDLYPSPTL